MASSSERYACKIQYMYMYLFYISVTVIPVQGHSMTEGTSLLLSEYDTTVTFLGDATNGGDHYTKRVMDSRVTEFTSPSPNITDARKPQWVISNETTPTRKSHITRFHKITPARKPHITRSQIIVPTRKSYSTRLHSYNSTYSREPKTMTIKVTSYVSKNLNHITTDSPHFSLLTKATFNTVLNSKGIITKRPKTLKLTETTKPIFHFNKSTSALKPYVMDTSPSTSLKKNSSTIGEGITSATYHSWSSRNLSVGSSTTTSSITEERPTQHSLFSSTKIPNTSYHYLTSSTEGKRAHVTSITTSYKRNSSEINTTGAETITPPITNSTTSRNTSVVVNTNKLPSLLSVLSTTRSAVTSSSVSPIVTGVSISISSMTNNYFENETNGSTNEKRKTSQALIIGVSVGTVFVICIVVFVIVYKCKKRNVPSKVRLQEERHGNVVPFSDFEVHFSHQPEDFSDYTMSDNMDLETANGEREITPTDKTYEVLRHVETGEMDYEVLKRRESANNGYVNYKTQVVYANVSDVNHIQHESDYHLDINMENQYANLHKIDYSL